MYVGVLKSKEFSNFTTKRKMGEEQIAYINQVYLKGYKSIQDLTVSLNRGINIIIGANGSGKTNFLDFLDAAYRSDYYRLLTGRKFEFEISGVPFSAKMTGFKSIFPDEPSADYRIDKTISINDKQYKNTYFFNEDVILVKEIGKNIESIDTDSLNMIKKSTLYLRFENPLNEILKQKFTLKLLTLKNSHITIKNGKEEEQFPLFSDLKLNNRIDTFLNDIFYIRRDVGIHYKPITDIIKEIIANQWFTFEPLRRNLKQFSPIQDIKIEWAFIRQTILHNIEDAEDALIEGIDFQFLVNGEWLNWTQLSDGTKRLFYIIGSVTYAKSDEIILMEEPELGVHPHQLTLLMNFLKAQSKHTQIILSTHSPQVLNCLNEDELDNIIIARHEGKEGTKMYHLSEEEKGFASNYIKNEAFLSDYWVQSGFMNEETIESV